MELRLLGPLEAVGERGAIPLGAAKERAVLAVLAVHAGEAVSEDRLLDVLWGDDTPRTAIKTLRSYVSRLRRSLADVEGRLSIETVPGGYRLQAAPDALDVARVEALAREARDATERADHAWAAVALSEALRAWRGAPLGEFADQSWAAAEAARLQELRETLIEEHIEAELACGRHAAASSELEALTAEYPLRERLWGQRMVALYRSGRQAEALRVYQDLRQLLGEELGIEPSPALKRLEEQVLAQDAALDWVRPAPPAPPAESSLPSGVVTFLLTDIEDSTSLWDRHPQAMAQALSRHDVLVRVAVETFGGVVLKARGEGDSTFSVFARATDAVMAARGLHRSVAAEAWPAETPVRIRIALHTGEALERDGDYYGPAVNRVARLREIAAGGQVLVSRATADVVVDHLPADCHLVDLGARELRDLARPETVFLLEMPSPAGTAEVDSAGAAEMPLPPRLASPPFTGFHGRAAELEVLAGALKQALAGDRRLIFVAGEPGIGKTALAAELARGAFADGVRVLYGRCDEDIGHPYQPWAEALTHLFEHDREHVADALGPRRLQELARLVPPLLDVVPEPPALVADAEAERYLLFGAVLAALGAAAADHGLVLVLDDLQWADVPSLLLLRHVVTSSDSLRLLVIATYRDSELSAGHPVTDALAALRGEPGVERCALRGLADEELRSFVEAAAGQPLEGAELDVVHALYRETDGNPFFAWELMRHLTETGAVRLGDDGRWVMQLDVDETNLPDSIREVIGRRVTRLGADVRHVLAAAAIVGHEFDLDVVAGAIDRSPDDVLEDLERAEVAGLVSSVGRGRFAFVHALIGHTLASDLGPTRRARLHQRVADAIERLGLGDDRVTELAYHWAAATGTIELDRAIHYARRSGDRALATLAPHEAVRWYEQALSLLAQRAAPDESSRCALLIALGTAQRQASDPAFRTTLLGAATLARELGDNEAFVSAALANSELGVGGLVDAERIAVLEDAIEAVGPRDSEARALLLTTLAVELSFVDDYPRRRAVADEALAVARRLGDRHTFLRTVGPWFTSLIVPETHAEREAVVREAAALVDARVDPVTALSIWFVRGWVAFEAGNLDEMQRSVDRQAALADEVGLPRLRHIATTTRAALALLAGDVAEAERLNDEAMDLGSRTAQLDAFTIYGTVLFTIRWHQGRTGELADLLAQGWAAQTNIPALEAATALLAIESGRSDVVLDDSLFSAMPYDAVWLPSRALLAEVVSRLGVADDRAALLYEQLSPHASLVANIPTTPLLGAVPHYLGMLAAVLGRYDEADAHFAHAHRVHERLRAPFHLARTQLEWGNLLLARGRPGDQERAVQLLDRALATARDYGCAGVERRAREALARATRVPLPAGLVPARDTFVGRADELDELRAAMARAAGQSRQLVLIAGEAGAGKTRLAAEFAVEAHREGATVLFGRCDEEALTPYQPFVEALRHYVLTCPPAVLREKTAGAGPELARVIPDLRERLPDLPPATAGETEGERYRLFETLHSFLGEVATTAPLLLVIEDLHWADAGSILLLRHLFRHAEPAAICVLATYRDVDVSFGHPLADALSELRQAGTGTRLQLGGLAPDDVGTLLSLELGQELDAAARAFAQRLWQQTEGNALFVHEVLRHLRETGALDGLDTQWTASRIGIPEGVKEAIGRRLARLSETARQALTVGAVIGREFDLDLLEGASGIDTDALVDAVEEASRSRLVVELSGGFGRYAFAHALIRDALYADLSTVRRVRLHLKVGEAIERVHANDLEPFLDELAHHFFEATQAGTAERAIDYGRRAGEQAMRQLAYEEAASRFGRALQAFELEESSNDAAEAELLLAFGDARRRAGDVVGAREVFRDAVEHGRRMRDADVVARAVLGYGAGSGGLNRASRTDEHLIALLEEALEMVGDQPAALRVRLMARLAEELYYTSEAERRATLGQQAVEMAEALGDPHVLLVALYAREHSRVGPDVALDERRASSAELVRLAEELGEREVAHQAHLLRELVLLELGEFEAASAEIDAATAIADELRIPSLQAWATAARARRAWMAGRFEEAGELNQMAMARAFEQGGDPEVATLVLGGQAMAHQLLRTSPEPLLPALREFAAQNPQHRIIRCFLCWVLAFEGLLDDARAELDALAANDFADIPHNESWLGSLWALSRACALLDDADRARVLYDAVAPHGDRWYADWASISFGPVVTTLGILCTTLGRYEDAAEHFEAAVAATDAAPSPPWAADARHQYALMLLARDEAGDREQARALLGEALAIADELGMAVLGDQLRTAMALAQR